MGGENKQLSKNKVIEMDASQAERDLSKIRT